ncbi:uncharacterized protein NPIL_557261 [Nephila pilipes]|uniref:Peptidase aspartic putative domain-containing protein n=1 Tax=Nephila pilipes TaxID=299642 RepID=A0A8X6PG00_NEPPI|nr:uncharacterized protein NPIL_557261 [Nephila pilipes]
MASNYDEQDMEHSDESRSSSPSLSEGYSTHCIRRREIENQIGACAKIKEGVTTDQCGVILYPLVESSLPIHILRSFERQRKNIDPEQSISTLDAKVSFLKSEVQSEEKIKLNRFEILPYERECKHLTESQRSLSYAAELFIQESNDTRAFCFKAHANRFCKRAFFIPLKEKIAIIKKKQLCRVCLAKGHLASRCRSQITCQLFPKRHLKFMCPNIVCNKSDSPKQEVNDKNINEKTVDSLHSRATNKVILQTLVVNVHVIKKERKARAIIDTGCQKSYILKSTAEDLGFNLQREEEFRHSLFGGTKTKMYKHKCYKIYLSSLDGNYICKLDALDHDVICNDISSVKNGSWIHELKTKNILLTDIQENTGPIEVFLGADVAGKLIIGRREELETGLVALETKLGWTLNLQFHVSN